MKDTLLFIMILFISSCNHTEKEKDKKSEEYMAKVEDDKIKYRFLDKENDEYILVVGTKTFDSVKLNYPELPYKYFNRASWIDNKKIFERINQKDSISFTSNNDTISISHCFFSKGRCLNFYPFYVTNRDTIYVYNPELLEGEVYVYKNDTMSMFVDCSLATISELIIKIPISKSLNQKIIKYKNRLLKLK